MSKNKLVKLNQIAKVVQGQSPESIYYSSIEGVPFMQGNRTFGDKYPFIDTFTSKITKMARKNDILMSVRAPVGDLNIASCDLCIGRGLSAITSKKVNNEFLYYSLKYNVQNLLRQGSGTTYSSVNKDIINDFDLIVPKDENSWESIASLLSSLDSKIELNNKINKELESMAKTLYDYWFVQFDFPDENGKPYKSSGGKMVYNLELKREIPEGWEVKKLDEIILKTGTGLNPRDNFKLGFGNNYYVTIKNIEQGKVVLDDKCDKVDDEALKIINRRSDLKVGDILFTSIQPVGVTYLIQEQPQNWNINESVFTIRPDYNLVSSDFLFMLLSSDFMKAYTNNVSAGSIHKGVRHTDLKSFKFAYSGNTIIKNFNKIVNPILKKMYINEQQNQELAKFRDWLLPMLMNGQVKVK